MLVSPPKRRVSFLTQKALSLFYPETPHDFEHFALTVDSILPKGILALEIGAGTGVSARIDWRRESRRVYGIDLDPRISGHPYLHRAALADATRLPFKSESFDAAISVNFMEHLEHPLETLREIHRILKPGGLYLAKMPNSRHYVARIAALTPVSFHRWYNARRGRNEADTFPTWYRFDTFEEVRHLSEEAGFEVLSIDGFEGVPEYLLRNAFLFLAGMAYERWVNRRPARKAFRATIEAVLQKPLLLHLTDRPLVHNGAEACSEVRE